MLIKEKLIFLVFTETGQSWYFESLHAQEEYNRHREKEVLMVKYSLYLQLQLQKLHRVDHNLLPKKLL